MADISNHDLVDGNANASNTIGLLHLANEILFDIFHHLPHKSLYNLALLSRRLNFISLPIFLSKHGISNPTEEPVSVEINDLLFLYTADYGPDVLSALQIALFISRISRLEISFPYPSLEMGADMIPFRRLLRRLHALVSKLTFIGSVTLFLNHPPFNTLARPRPPKRPRLGQCVRANLIIPDPIPINIDDALHEVSSGFVALFTELLQKSCSSLNLEGNCPLTSALPFWGTDTGTPIPSFTALGDLFGAGNSSIPSYPLQGLMCYSPGTKDIDAILARIPSSVRAKSGLRSMKISSAVNVVIPPFSFATISILRASDIRQLTLTEVHMEKRLWMIILPLILAANPRLEDLSITNCWHIPTTLVFRSLKKLSSLTSLTLCNALWYDMAIDVGPSLPHLTKLCASLEWIFPFLVQFPTALPLLENLIVIPSAESASIELKMFSSFLPSLIHRLIALRLFPEISVQNICTQRSDGVIRFTLKEVESSLNQQVSGNIPLARRLIAAGWLQMFPASRDVLDFIVNVALQLSDVDPSLDEGEVLVQWLSLFPKMQRLSVSAKETDSTTPAVQKIVALAGLRELSVLEVNGKEINMKDISASAVEK